MILERHIDFAMPLHHSPIYQSLLHDLLGLKSNHVNITKKDNKQEQIFLDYENDTFWQKNSLEPLPKVHEYHTNVLQWYQNKKAEIDKKDKGGSLSSSPSQTNDNDYDEFDDEKKNESQHDLLKSTIKSMPELLQKKAEIDRHNNLMTSVSEVLSERAISNYFHLEEALMHSKILDSQQSKQLNEQLTNLSKGTIEDKLRLFLIYYLCHHDVKRQTLNELIDKLLTNEINDELNKYLLSNYHETKNKLKALKYIIDHKKFLNLAESLADNDEEKGGNNDSNSASNRLTSWLGSGGSLLAKVKGMLPTSGKCTVTRIVRLLMNTDIASITNTVATSSINVLSQSQSNPHLKNINKNYVTFDPLDKNKNNNNKSNDDRVNFQEYQRGIVFVVGGGCFAEYANLNEFANTKNKNVIYGCTDIVSPNDFLTQLSNLGQN